LNATLDVTADASGLISTVGRLDRLGRTAKGLTSLFEDLIRWKVNLISLKDGLDLVTPAGRLMANILAGVAAYETEVRAERTLAGQAAARERGIRRGGSIRGRRIRATAEQIPVIRRLRRRVEKSPRSRRPLGYPDRPSIGFSARTVPPHLDSAMEDLSAGRFAEQGRCTLWIRDQSHYYRGRRPRLTKGQFQLNNDD
jgi:hypothetical protein